MPPVNDSFIRIDKPEDPVYRVLPVWRFEELLRLRKLTLVTPSSWHDPFETLTEGIALEALVNGKRIQQFVGSDIPLPSIFCQCWSRTNESDALWRIYSQVKLDSAFSRNTRPAEEGVRVRSTSKKLLDALNSILVNGNKYIGSVKYLPESDFLQEIANLVCANGVNVFSTPRNRAELQLRKREFFEHESEVRIMHIPQKTISDKRKDISIDPNKLIDEVTFDPRLKPFEIRERENAIKQLGYTGKITESTLYQSRLLEVPLPPTNYP